MNKPAHSNNEPKLISVIIPVFNGENFIAEAIQNVISQNYSPIEIIVIDDGSTDETALIVQNFPFVKYHFQKQAGPAKARNSGLNIAKGELIAFLDCDDLWNDNHLFNLLNILNKNYSAGIAQGLVQELNYNEVQKIFCKLKKPFFNALLGSCLIRKSVFKKIGYFDEQLIFGEDTDWIIRAWENDIKKLRINEISLFYRKHSSNMTNDIEKKIFYRKKLLKLKLERQKNIPEKKTNSITLKNYLG